MRSSRTSAIDKEFVERRGEQKRGVMYGSPPPPPKDLNLPYPPVGPFGSQRTEGPESDLFHRQQEQQHMTSGLHRYRSAPSSLLGEVCEDTETMFARLLAPDLRAENRDEPSGGAATAGHSSPHCPPPPPSAQEVNEQQSRGFSSTPQMLFQPQQQQQKMPNHSLAESSFPVAMGSLAMDTEQIKNGGFGSSSNLIRQSSSPGGLFHHLNVDNGYGMVRGMGGFRDGSSFMMDGTNNRSKGQISFSSRQNSIMSQISEVGSEEDVEGSSPKEGSSGGQAYQPGFPVASWDDPPMFNCSFIGLKGGTQREEKMVAGLSSFEHQNGEVRNHASGLPHQLSLPKNSTMMTTIEKFVQFHDAVPCKIRAKRGCATHPRSIAERVRRTRISERMKKLQELVPNMDKQTNTADMLDLAVDYIKDLQKQVKALSENRASCSCSASRQR